jgi:putative restriction endonuclease
MNPRNGLCLNALHDKAFDTGVITISESFNVVVSHQIRSMPHEKASLILSYDGISLNMPNRFIPDQTFLISIEKMYFWDND